MKKNIFIGLVSLLLFISQMLRSQDYLEVLNPSEATDLYYSHLMEKFDSLLSIRKDSFSVALESEAKQLMRRERIRSVYKELMGEESIKSPLLPEVVGSIDRSELGFYIEKLHFQSLPDHRVTANFYIPYPDTGNYPAVYIMPGHYPDGKAAPILQKLSMLFAMNGIAALIIDPMGQAERAQIVNPETGSLTDIGSSGTSSQSQMDYGSILVGKAASYWELWDNRRGLDYLYSRTDVVDTSKIGATGSSGGGAQLLWLLGMEYDRIEVAALTSWLTNKSYIFGSDGSQAGSHHLYYQGIYNIDQPEQMLMYAPKPLILIAGSKDFIDTAGTHEAAQEMKEIYESLGASAKLEYFESPDEHGYTMPKREAAVRFFRTWFYDDPSEVTDSDPDALPVSDLQVTSTGQVYTSFENERTVIDINVDLAFTKLNFHQLFWSSYSKDSCLSKVSDLIKLNENYSSPTIENRGSIDREEYTIDKLLIKSEGEIPIPALLFKAKSLEGEHEALVFMDEAGKSNHAERGGYLEKLCLDSGKIVLALDLRGCGETEDFKSDAKYGSDDHRLNIVSMYIGETMMGQRVEEVQKALDILRNDANVDPEGISLQSLGRLGPVALHVAAFDPGIKEVVLHKTFESWLDIVSNATIPDIMSYVVPGALEYYDLPNLQNAIGADKVHYRKSMESRLSRIAVLGGRLEPAFSDTIHSYEVGNISREEIKITGYLKDSDATIIGNDTYTLRDSSFTVELKSTAEDGITSSSYFVTLPAITGEKKFFSGAKQSQVYPNPFQITTYINYYLPEAGLVQLNLFGLDGRKLMQIEESYKGPGSYTTMLDGTGLETGIYILQFKMGEEQENLRIIKTE